MAPLKIQLKIFEVLDVTEGIIVKIELKFWVSLKAPLRSVKKAIERDRVRMNLSWLIELSLDLIDLLQFLELKLN